MEVMQSRIWENRSALEVQWAFQSIYGVGQQIANLSVLLLEYRFDIRFSDLDHRKMDIKADTHTCQYYIGLVWQRMRLLIKLLMQPDVYNPGYPGAIDGILWVVGRTWCHPSWPKCEACPLTFGV